MTTAVQRMLAAGLMAALFACAAQAADQVTVVMRDDRFEPDHVIFRAGVPVQLVLENRGKELHEFTAPAFLHAAAIKDRRALSSGGGDIVVQSGKTVRIALIPGPAGEYPLTCADHDWDGMTGTIAVVP